METSEKFSSFFMALRAFQKECPPIKKDASNDYFGSKYATYEKIWASIRELVFEHGFAVSHGFTPYEKGVGITTLIVHESGEWLKTTAPLPLQKLDPQGVGSAQTYGERINLKGLLGLAIEDGTDDDGNLASGNTRGNHTQNEQTNRGDDL